MRITAEPRSDQWNGDDFASGPKTFSIGTVVDGKAEAKYDIELTDGGERVWRPPLTMLRILMATWGEETELWRGHRVTLFLDPEVMFGGDKVGGIRISHLSHLDKPLLTKVTKKRGRRENFTVQPLTEPAPNPAPKPTTEPTREQIAACTDLAELRDWWKAAGPELRAQIEARKAELDTTAPVEGDER